MRKAAKGSSSSDDCLVGCTVILLLMTLGCGVGLLVLFSIPKFTHSAFPFPVPQALVRPQHGQVDWTKITSLGMAKCGKTGEFCHGKNFENLDSFQKTGKTGQISSESPKDGKLSFMRPQWYHRIHSCQSFPLFGVKFSMRIELRQSSTFSFWTECQGAVLDVGSGRGGLTILALSMSRRVVTAEPLLKNINNLQTEVGIENPPSSKKKLIWCSRVREKFSIELHFFPLLQMCLQNWQN